jgi:hypothetical protein
LTSQDKSWFSEPMSFSYFHLAAKVIFIFSSTLLMMLTGCSSGAVIFEPTPMPADLSPARYDHPGGAFSITVPPDWAVYTQNTGTLVSASFSPPNTSRPSLTVAAINTGTPIEATNFAELVQQYQSLYRPDLNRYQPDGRDPLGDGSWRLTGSRTVPGQPSEALNTFIGFQGTWVTVTDVVIPADGALQTQLQNAVNSLQLNTSAGLQPTALETLSLVRADAYALQNVNAWNNASGALFITGEVGNYSGQAVPPMTVRVALLTEAGQIADAADVTMGYAIPAGGFAPFSLRFGEGVAPGNSRYTVSLVTAGWDAAPPQFVGQDTLIWEDASSFDTAGTLHITGSVTNEGQAAVADLIGVITVFDVRQQVIAAWFAPLSNEALPAGGRLAFDIRVPEIGGEPVNYILDIQAQTSDSQTES